MTLDESGSTDPAGAEQIVGSKAKKKPKAKKSEPRFKLLSVEELEKLPDPTWLIDGMIPEGTHAEWTPMRLCGSSFAGWKFSVTARTVTDMGERLRYARSMVA